MNTNKIIEAVSVDCLIFGFIDSELYVLLVKHGTGPTHGQWAIPGSWVRYNEDIDSAANRVLKSQTSINKIYLEQFKTFGKVERYPFGRVITIAYYALIDIEKVKIRPGKSEEAVEWFPVNNIPDLAFDHKKILDSGLAFLKNKILHEPIGFNLLPPSFTLLQLLTLYEAILQKKLDKSNFRKKFLKMDLLIETKKHQKQVSHRAAKYYRFDTEVYDKLKLSGFIFGF